jgi:hypothetical protein
MSICSDVFITEEEARQRVKRMLMYEQELLIQLAVNGMKVWELSSYLNRDDDGLYFYNITKTKKVKNANKSGPTPDKV